MGIRDSLLQKYIKYKIDKINEAMDLKEYFKEVPHAKVSSLAIVITDVGDNVGFGYDAGKEKIVELSDLETPTLEIRCTKKVFKAVITGKIQPDELYYGNLADFVGNYQTLYHKLSLELLFKLMQDKGAI